MAYLITPMPKKFHSVCEGTLPPYLAFFAKMQLLPAILYGSAITVAALLVLTVIFGRVYCSIVCSLGVFQDVVGAFGRKFRFHHTPGKTRLRMVGIAIFAIAFLTGFPILFGTLEPYSAFGRIATGLLAPIWALANNGLAHMSERMENYWVSSSPIFIKGWYAFGIASLTFIVVGLLAYKGGRTWCNTLCPVGTVFGVISRFSMFRTKINSEKCTNCRLCEKSCKASCIDSKNGTIDAMRCVACFNCLDACKNNSIV